MYSSWWVIWPLGNFAMPWSTFPFCTWAEDHRVFTFIVGASGFQGLRDGRRGYISISICLLKWNMDSGPLWPLSFPFPPQWDISLQPRPKDIRISVLLSSFPFLPYSHTLLVSLSLSLTLSLSHTHTHTHTHRHSDLGTDRVEEDLHSLQTNLSLGSYISFDSVLLISGPSPRFPKFQIIKTADNFTDKMTFT